MKSIDIIDTALEYGNKYNGDITSLLRDKEIKIIKIELENIFGFTVNINEKDIVFINSKLSTNSLEYYFTLAHEVAHIIFHDKSSRAFHKQIHFESRIEREANLFATIFLDLRYKDCIIDDTVQKIANDILYNFSYIADVSRSV